MNRSKKEMNETEIRTNFITPAIVHAGWDKLQQIREEFRITDGRIITRGKVVTRANPKFADYVLNHILAYCKQNIEHPEINSKR